MTRGLYIAASGMLNGLHRQDSIANNLANIDTPGYKRDVTISEAFPSMLLRRVHDIEQVTPKLNIDRRPYIGTLGTGVLATDVLQDFSQGALQHTGNALDLAIVDPPPQPNQASSRAFFVVQTPQGVRYTRNGSFQVNSQMQLVTSVGHTVLDTQGNAITVPGGSLQVGSDGGLWSGGNQVATLQLVDISPTALAKQGDSLYSLAAGAPTAQAIAGTSIQAGYLERSNINVVTEMVNMISVLRAYEANQRALHAQDDATDIAIREVGRSR